MIQNCFCKFTLFLIFTLAWSSAFAQIKPTPGEERLNGLQKRNTLGKRSLVNDIAFRNIGPAVMSGRVTDIDANPNDPTEFYIAYASGGLWYTKNNGQSFDPVFDSADVLTIGDIAVDWSSPKTIWVGTGEANSSRSSYAGIGIYKSSDNGKTWEYLGLPESHHIGKIQLHPTDKNTAWVAVLGHLYSPNKERGVYKTKDGGKTWKQTLYVDENTGAADIDINPQNPNELYAATWYRIRHAWDFTESGKTSGIYKSVDGGDTWTLLTKEGSGFPTGDGNGRIGIAVCPKNPQAVYAVIDNQDKKPSTDKKDSGVYKLEDFKNLTKEQFLNLDDQKLDSFLTRNRMSPRYTAKSVKDLVVKEQIKPTAIYDYLNVNTGFEGSPIGCEVYRTDDGGKDWKKTHEEDINIFFTYGYYFGKIYVSPNNENKVYVLGVSAQVSNDGGKTFTSLDKPNVHGDHHALWIDPQKDIHLINGNDGGCNITYDDGEHWFKANTPSVGQFYSIAVDNDKPYNVYGGLQDNGVWYTPSVAPRNSFSNSGLGLVDGVEKNIGGGDGMQVQVDTRDNATIYYGSQFGNYARRNRQQKARPTIITPQHKLGELPFRFNWQSPILLSKHNQDVLYFGSNRFHRSLNQGDSMVTMSADLTDGGKPGNIPFGTLTTIAESPTRFGLIYVGTDDGNIDVTMEGGYAWTKVSGKLPQNLWVSRLEASRFKEGRVYASLNGYRFDNFEPYLYVSDDYGNTWKRLGKDLPAEPINVVREDVKNDSILYVGTDGGLYVSLDAGNSFMMWNKGLPKSVPVHDIVIQARENEIILGTHGRSIYIAKLDSLQLLKSDKNYYERKKQSIKASTGNTQVGNLPEIISKPGMSFILPKYNEYLN